MMPSGIFVYQQEQAKECVSFYNEIFKPFLRHYIGLLKYLTKYLNSDNFNSILFNHELSFVREEKMGRTASDLKRSGWPAKEIAAYHPWLALDRYSKDEDLKARKKQALETGWKVQGIKLRNH
jgi:hypothetical protein